MFEMKAGVTIVDLNSIDLPYSIRIYGVTEEMFDELVNEDIKAELIDGEMIMHSPASLEHEDLGCFLGGLMRFYSRKKRLGKFIASGNGIVHIATGRKFAPDGFFIKQERVPNPLPQEFEGNPDLVLEVLSPSNRNEDLTKKRPAYQEAEVPEIWFVDRKNKQLIIDRKKADGYVEQIVSEGHVASDVIEGFWIEVSWLWETPLPDDEDCLQQILSES